MGQKRSGCEINPVFFGKWSAERKVGVLRRASYDRNPSDRIKEQGGEPFRDYSLPEAILKFRQGVGRLIRTATDEGIVVILDQRIVTKRYGRLFLKSIPECPVEIVEK